MKRMLLAALLTITALLASGSSAKAQSHPHFPPFGCGGFCIGFLSKAHFHGPLFNYGPYSGYYPFEPYGPWSSNLQYNPPPVACGHGDRGLGLGWGKYAVSTLKNVFHRTSPLANRCGGGLNLGSCGSCGKCGATTPCAGGGCSAATSVEPAPAVAIVPNAVPGVLAAQAK